jgi:hypothetical protein
MDVTAAAAAHVALTQFQVQTELTGRLLKLAQSVDGAQNAPKLIEQVAETAAAISRGSGVDAASGLDAYA